MDRDELTRLTAIELAALIRDREVSPVDVTEDTKVTSSLEVVTAAAVWIPPLAVRVTGPSA